MTHASTISSAFNTHHISLLHYAARILHDRYAAEDIVQDVFFKLLQAPEPVNIGQYVSRMVHNECISYLKRQTRDNMLLKAMPDEPDERLVYEAEIFARIAREIAKLPEQSARIMELRFRTGKNDKEIGKILGISHHTVRNLVAISIKKLRLVIKI
jgi:RNA polymerase sigma factor (sigma-70 family)